MLRLMVSAGMLAALAFSTARRRRGLAQIAAAGTGCHHDFSDDTGPDLAPLFVLPALAVLNIGPFAVSCHAKSFKKFVTLAARLYFSGLS
jgi:hypothetical protein